MKIITRPEYAMERKKHDAEVAKLLPRFENDKDNALVFDMTLSEWCDRTAESQLASNMSHSHEPLYAVAFSAAEMHALLLKWARINHIEIPEHLK